MSRGRPKKELDDKYIISEYAKHRSTRSIANDLSISKNTVVRVLQSHGIHVRSKSDVSEMIKNDYRSILPKDQLAELYSTKTIEEISDDTRVPLHVVIDLVHEYRLEKESVTYQRSTRESVRNINVADLISKYRDGMISLTRLSEATGHSIRTLADKLKGSDVQIRDRADRRTICNSMIARYGVDCYSKTDECKKKISQTCMDRYGVASFSKTDDFRAAQSDRMKKETARACGRAWWQVETANSAVKIRELIDSLPPNYRRASVVADVLNYSYSHIIRQFHKYGLSDYFATDYRISSYENEIAEYLSSLGITNIEQNARGYLDGKEIDIYLPDFRIGIEFNGDYWHSDMFKTDHSGRSTYHQEKSLLAESKGIFLYHIFEYEWNNPIERQRIKNQLMNLLRRNKTKIYARKCIVRPVSADEKADFLNKNHLQGNCASTHNIGLCMDGKIVSLMCFKRRRTGQYKYELVRFCSLAGTNVIGGASKLLSHFVDDHLSSGEKIVSYSNITKTRGDLYKVLGFEFAHISSPNYVWINTHTHDILTRYQCKMKNEASTMHSRGYIRICDAGTKTWAYTKR